MLAKLEAWDCPVALENLEEADAGLALEQLRFVSLMEQEREGSLLSGMYQKYQAKFPFILGKVALDDLDQGRLTKAVLEAPVVEVEEATPKLALWRWFVTTTTWPVEGVSK